MLSYEVGAVAKFSSFDGWVLAGFAPLLVLTASAIAIEVRRRPFSLHVMHLLFGYLYLGVAPVQQYLNGRFPYTDHLPFQLTDTDLTWTNIAVFSWYLIYIFGYFRPPKARPTGWRALLSRTVTNTGMRCMLFAALAALAWLSYLGFAGAVTRGAADEIGSASAQGTSLAIVNYAVVRSIPIFGLGAIILARQRFKGHSRWLITLLGSALSAGIIWLDNPLAAARFFTAMAFIGLATILILRTHRTGALLVPALVAGVFIVMPLLDRGRYATSGSAYRDGEARRIGESDTLLNGGDYDAYSSILRTEKYIDNSDKITWGRQLLGVALFWVPRVIWTTKPIGSGAFMATDFGWEFTNIASALPAEALINFGWLGLPLFALIFGRLLRRLDDLYWDWNVQSPAEGFRVIEVVYPFWLGMVIFISRGDLLSGLSFTVGITVAGLPLWIGSKRTIEGAKRGRSVEVTEETLGTNYMAARVQVLAGKYP